MSHCTSNILAINIWHVNLYQSQTSDMPPCTSYKCLTWHLVHQTYQPQTSNISPSISHKHLACHPVSATNIWHVTLYQPQTSNISSCISHNIWHVTLYQSQTSNMSPFTPNISATNILHVKLYQPQTSNTLYIRHFSHTLHNPPHGSTSFVTHSTLWHFYLTTFNLKPFMVI